MARRFEIVGAEALIKKLKKNATLNDVKDVIRMNTAEMHKGAIRNAPVQSGDLRRAIRIDVKEFEGKVASTIDYAPYQEWGTRFQEGTPHVGPAFHHQKQRFLDDMKRFMR